jgi:hypothetical protein
MNNEIKEFVINTVVGSEKNIINAITKANEISERNIVGIVETRINQSIGGSERRTTDKIRGSIEESEKRTAAAIALSEKNNAVLIMESIAISERHTNEVLLEVVETSERNTTKIVLGVENRTKELIEQSERNTGMLIEHMDDKFVHAAEYDRTLLEKLDREKQEQQKINKNHEARILDLEISPGNARITTRRIAA